MITPSDKQAAAISAIVTWYMGGRSTPQIFRLFGYAGTGKSTIVEIALAELRDKAKMGKHATATFTGKAASVLRKKGNPDARTIHSLIYMPTVDELTGKTVFKLAWDGPAADVDLIVLDECSMVDRAMAEDVLAFGKKVLVIGDPGQLPPVSGPGFFVAGEPDAFLDEVHRQAGGSPILWLATRARLGQDLPLGEYDGGESGFARVLPLNSETQREVYREETQALCGVHKVRIGYTQRIRRLRGFEGERPQAGELILLRKNDRDLGVFNGQLARLWADPRPYKRRAGDDEADSVLIRMDLAGEDIPAPLVDLKVHPFLFDRHFDPGTPEPKFRKGIQWADWGNVLTMHSAQGSEWPDVTIVDDSAVFREDRHRWRYTGLTRAAERVTFLKRAA